MAVWKVTRMEASDSHGQPGDPGRERHERPGAVRVPLAEDAGALGMLAVFDVLTFTAAVLAFRRKLA